MRAYSRPSFFTGNGAPQPGLATRWLCGALVLVSVLSTMTQRKFGVGIDRLTFEAGAVLHGEVWRLLSYAFVKRHPVSLLLSAVVLWMFGRWYETQWGSRDYLRFFFLSTVGAAVAALPLSWLLNVAMPFDDLGFAEGPDAAVDAMMVALAINAPSSRVMFGLVLPMPAKSLVWLLLGIDLISGFMTGASTMSITLGGMLMGYLLVTGNWRPHVLLTRVRTARRRRKQMRGLYVVPPRDRNLH